MRTKPDHHDAGLASDLATFVRRFASRRQVLKLFGAAGLIPIIGCAAEAGVDVDAGETSIDGADGACTAIPSETAGPYPGDGTNGANALALSGIVRRDIRTSTGTASGVAEGVLLTVTLTVVDAGAGCAPLAGRAVYLWHCDRDGDYSMYTGGAAAENYLRGVQETDADGVVTFTTIFPACYSGRWPHIHLEVYPSLASATHGENAAHTSQLALPEASCQEVFATAGYETSVGNLEQVSLDRDNVFRDGATTQLAAISGGVDVGYLATLTVGVPA